MNAHCCSDLSLKLSPAVEPQGRGPKSPSFGPVKE